MAVIAPTPCLSSGDDEAGLRAGRVRQVKQTLSVGLISVNVRFTLV